MIIMYLASANDESTFKLWKTFFPNDFLRPECLLIEKGFFFFFFTVWVAILLAIYSCLYDGLVE